MQQIKKKLYAAPRVKSVKFQVEQGFQCSGVGCPNEEMRYTLENYKLDNVTENPFGDLITSNSGSTTGN